MLKPFDEKIQQLAFVYAHSGLKADRNNRIYAYAAAIIDTDKPKAVSESFVRYSLLTGREKYYSGISKEMLAAAPAPQAAADRLAAFLENQKFIFVLDNHNRIEDLKKFCGDVRVIDLSFAAEFFLPHLESYTPKRLWEYLNGKQREKAFFTAAEIVDLSVELVKHICGNVLNDRIFRRAAAIRYYLRKSRTLFGEVFLHITEHYKAYFGGLFDPCTLNETKNWQQFLEKAVKFPPEQKEKSAFKKISSELMESLYRAMSDAAKDYVFRHSQVEYAKHVGAALNDNAVLTLEAGTGTGKTQGYLIPVMEFLYRNPHARVVVSTYTKNLQQQIFQREISFTKEIFKLYQDIPVAVLKGKSGYICAEKLDHAYESSLEGEQLLTWLYFVNLVFHFRDADGDAAGEKITAYLNDDFYFYQLLNEISAKDGCTPKHSRCPAQVVTAEAQAARLVITNHHKLVLLDKDVSLSGLFKIYIIDEANHFENAVRGALGQEVNSWEIGDVLRALEPMLKNILKRAKGEYEHDLDKALERISTIRETIRLLRASLIAINPKASLGQVKELPCDHPAFEEGRIKDRMNTLKQAFQDIGKDLKWIRENDVCRSLKIVSKTSERIRIYLNKFGEYAASIGAIETGLVSEDKVTAYQCFRKNWSVVSQSVEVAELIRRHIYEKADCIVYTAATLCYRGSFDAFSNITGLDRPLTPENGAKPKAFRFELIPSPFSKDAAEIVVPQGAANGRFENKAEWLASVVRLIPELIEKNKGRTLVLFSSYSDLIAAAEKAAESITTYPLLIQQQGVSTVNLCDEFREIKESVLFGVDTFWYGVDFKGDTLTQVIITRIPYPSFFDPIQVARKKLMSPKAFWMRYYYDAEIKMKQGIGRLIRSDTDRGKVVILDSRYKIGSEK